MITVKHEEMLWQANDGIALYAQRWEPDEEAKAVLCLVHGLGEHSSRYRHWADKFTGAGYSVLALDLRGHGKSGGLRGDAPSFDHIVDDVSLLAVDAESRYPGKPSFIYGHSLGGLIALYYLIQRQPDFTGAIITNPGLRTALELQKTKVALARILGSITPKLTLQSGLEQVALSRDPAVIEAYRNDPLVHDRISARMGKSTLEAIDYIFSHANRIELPLLLMHGSDDRIAFCTGSEELSSRLPEKCTLKLWKGFYHELHNEQEKDEIFGFIINWLDSKI
jgi:alpha-beta hydrolase superfamily lysophospholipase